MPFAEESLELSIRPSSQLVENDDGSVGVDDLIKGHLGKRVLELLHSELEFGFSSNTLFELNYVSHELAIGISYDFRFLIFKEFG